MGNNLNDGKVHDFDEVNKYGLEKAAEDFSENSPYLKQALLSLWNLGIETKSCCKGTIEKDHKTFMKLLKYPYLTMVLNKESNKTINKLCCYLMAQNLYEKPDIKFEMYADPIIREKAVTLSKLFWTNKNTEKMFEIITSATNQVKLNTKISKTPLQKNICKIFDILAKSKCLNNAESLFVFIKDNNAKVSITTDDKDITIPVTNNNMEAILSLLNKHLIPLKQKINNDEKEYTL